MKFNSTFIIMILALSMATVGCTKQIVAKHWGGTSEESLPPGQKLVNATWEEANLWYVTRPFHADEKPETYTIVESSSYGVFQGTLIVHEVAKQ